jgi:hypothetical protein
MPRPPKPREYARIREIAAIMREHGCDADEAGRILNERERQERQAKVESFTAELEARADTVGRAAKTIPHHRRELMMELPWRQGLGIAVRHLAPRERVRGRCERRPSVRAVRRPRSSRATRAGPDADGESDPPGAGDTGGVATSRLEKAQARRLPGSCACCFHDPRPWRRPGERRDDEVSRR